MAMSPAFNDYVADPGSGRRVTFRRGLLLPDEISQLKDLWSRVVGLVETLDDVPWRYLLELIHDWAYPSLHTSNEPPAEVTRDMRAFAECMVADVARVCNGHPGVLHKAADYARDFGWDLKISPDPEFETLFPAEGLRARNYQELRDRQLSAVRELAAGWSEDEPTEVSERIARLDTAAEAVNKTYPRHTPELCEEIAVRTERSLDWLRALLDSSLAPGLVTPFLLKAASDGEEGWKDVAYECLQNPALESAAIFVVALTTPEPPSDLLSEVSRRLGPYTNVVEIYCMRGQVPEQTLAYLLHHEDPAVASAAALGEWHADPRGSVRQSLASDWRAAMLEASTDQHLTRDILRSDPALAHDWLLRRVTEERILGDVNVEPSVENALAALDREQKLSVLRSVRPGSMYHSLAAAIVGDDLQLYGDFLQDAELTRVHVWPLVDKPTGLWPEKARLALDAGYSAEQVAGTAFLSITGWSGNEFDMWERWIGWFSELLSHGDEGVRAVAEHGVAHAQQGRSKALGEERDEDVYGF